VALVSKSTSTAVNEYSSRFSLKTFSDDFYNKYNESPSLQSAYGYDLITKKFLHTFENGLVDSSKSIRAILWNSLTLVSIIITSE
jgi:chaperonin GroEL (HSP60 family)